MIRSDYKVSVNETHYPVLSHQINQIYQPTDNKFFTCSNVIKVSRPKCQKFSRPSLIAISNQILKFVTTEMTEIS